MTQKEHYIPDLKLGLSAEEVKERIDLGQTNHVSSSSSRSIKDILHANILTRFNAILSIMAIAVLIAQGGILNTAFFWIMVINSGIGIFQELRAKHSLDKLAILAEAHAKVLRDGKFIDISLHDVVKDDLIQIQLGNQIVADGEIVESSGLEIDESLLTGESEPIMKTKQDEVLSGSIVVAGKGLMIARKVGSESYSSKITVASKQFKRASSELIDSTNRLLRWISLMLVFIAPMLIIGQLRLGKEWQSAVIRSVAAIVGMIPEGLVMLTSIAFMLAVLRLTRKQVLVQSLPAVETLARVNTLLLDKTGTLTEGSIHFENIFLSENLEGKEEESKEILASFASMGESPTNSAIREGVDKEALNIEKEVPFSSARKWSATQINEQAYVLGAPEVLLANPQTNELVKFKNQAQEIASQGKRVLVLVKTSIFPADEKLIGEISPFVIVVLSENIRHDANETLTYFAKQEVDIKVISGDSPLTVAAVAREVGLGADKDGVKFFDARELPDPEEKEKFLEIVKAHNVFGRVQPSQKQAIASALQEDGRVVAMTGDGVNDALALKKADLGIAMQSGADSTKAVAEIVLMDNKFSHLPSVLAEGRRVIANIERVSSLFLIKNVYSVLLAIGVTIFGLAYPYLPIQMSLINLLSIGLPAFFFALAPNNRVYQKGFLKRVISFSIPVGFIAAVAMLIDYSLIQRFDASSFAKGTSVSIVTMMISISVLIILARPFKLWKALLIVFSASAFTLCLLVPFTYKLFSYEINLQLLPTTLIVGTLGAAIVLSLKKLLDKVLHTGK